VVNPPRSRIIASRDNRRPRRTHGRLDPNDSILSLAHNDELDADLRLDAAEELVRLRNAMKGEATGTRDQDKAIGAVADAEEAATRGDGPAALQYLKSAGEWTLGVAEKIGVGVAIEALKRAI